MGSVDRLENVRREHVLQIGEHQLLVLLLMLEPELKDRAALRIGENVALTELSHRRVDRATVLDHLRHGRTRERAAVRARELLADVVFRLLPATDTDIEAMLDDLANPDILGEFRGEPAADRAAIVEALVALARVGAEEPGLRSADLNPLILVDGKPIAVDALLEIEEVAS